ncbi:artemin [Tupaia chinensis]|uniref:artemin n=1 Tax=Tupaia chinensis TaxID=246437 RepID=UPI000FFC7028|nr:artemin [Tupaia chinensis]
MDRGLGGPSVLPSSPWPRLQSALWPTLTALALLSSVAEASLGPGTSSPAPRGGPAPVLAPPAAHLPGGHTARLCGGRAGRPSSPQPPRPAPPRMLDANMKTLLVVRGSLSTSPYSGEYRYYSRWYEYECPFSSQRNSSVCTEGAIAGLRLRYP